MMLYSKKDDIDLEFILSDIVTFFRYGADVVTIDHNNINLDDDNADDVESIIYVRL